MNYILICLSSLLMHGINDNTSIIGVPANLIKDSTNEIVIRGHSNNLPENSTVILRVWKEVLMENAPVGTPYLLYKCHSSDGKFSFKIDNTEEPVYFSLFYTGGAYFNEPLNHINLYLAAPGDHINITITKKSLRFNGIGADKYRCRYQLDSLVQANINLANKKYKFANKKHKGHILDKMKYMDTSFAVNWYKKTKNEIQQKDLELHQMLELLKRYKYKISETSYSLYNINIVSENFIEKLNSINRSNNRLQRLDKLAKKKSDRDIVLSQEKDIKSLYLKTFSRLDIDTISSWIKNHSKSYLDLTYNRLLQNEKYKYHSLEDIYNIIMQQYEGTMKDKLLTYYFIQNFNNLMNGDKLINYAIPIVKDSTCLVILKKISNRNEGKLAYNFNLEDEKGEMIKLNQFKGKVVFLDFWFSGCGGCASYYKNVLSYVEDTFKDNSKVVFLSISIDENRNKWLKSINENIYTSANMTNVINLYTNGDGYEGKVIKSYNIIEYPHPMIIDKTGIIYNSNSVQLRNRDLLIKMINTLLKEILNG